MCHSSLLLFTGTLLYGDFSSSQGLYGDNSLWRFFSLYGDFFPLYGDFTGTLLNGDFSSLRGLFFLFTGTLRELFSMETFPLFLLYEDFTGTLRGLFSYGNFSSLRGLFSSLRGLYGGLYGNSSLRKLLIFFFFTGTLRGLTGTLLYGDFSSFSSLRGLFSSLRGL